MQNVIDSVSEDLSQGLLLWAIECHGWGRSNLPMVYSNRFRLEYCLPHLNKLLFHNLKCIAIYRKALFLLESLLKLNTDEQWTADLLRSESYSVNRD